MFQVCYVRQKGLPSRSDSTRHQPSSLAVEVRQGFVLFNCFFYVKLFHLVSSLSASSAIVSCTLRCGPGALRRTLRRWSSSWWCSLAATARRPRATSSSLVSQRHPGWCEEGEEERRMVWCGDVVGARAGCSALCLGGDCGTNVSKRPLRR